MGYDSLSLVGVALPPPNEYVEELTYRGGTLVMADGRQVSDIVAGPRRVWRLGWSLLTDTERSDVQNAFLSLVASGSGTFVSADGLSYTVTTDGMPRLAWRPVNTSWGIRYSGELRLREI